MVLNAFLYIVRTGYQWQNSPKENPKWTTVYYYFRKWTRDGTFEEINFRLNYLDRQRELKKPIPYLLYVDSQSIKLNPMLEKYKGIDGNKKINAAMELGKKGSI